MGMNCVHLFASILLVWNGVVFGQVPTTTDPTLAGAPTAAAPTAAPPAAAPPAAAPPAGAPAASNAASDAAKDFRNKQAPLGGKQWDTLTSDFEVLPGAVPFNKLVANNKAFYVVNAVQNAAGNQKLYNPYTIGMVLGYIYEKKQRQAHGIPEPSQGGPAYTIEKAQLGAPVRHKRELPTIPGFKAGKLVFTKKRNVEKEDKYWKDLLEMNKSN
uniref:Uncharacterized protein n=2 Tax=Caenorhabditis japonica TaxID=281687 RepID=A0A8R1DWJ5_CAEJA